MCKLKPVRNQMGAFGGWSKVSEVVKKGDKSTCLWQGIFWAMELWETGFFSPSLFPLDSRVQDASILHESRLPRERERTVEGRDWLTAKVKLRLLCQGGGKEWIGVICQDQIISRFSEPYASGNYFNPCKLFQMLIMQQCSETRTIGHFLLFF